MRQTAADLYSAQLPRELNVDGIREVRSFYVAAGRQAHSAEAGRVQVTQARRARIRLVEACWVRSPKILG